MPLAEIAKEQSHSLRMWGKRASRFGGLQYQVVKARSVCKHVVFFEWLFSRIRLMVLQRILIRTLFYGVVLHNREVYLVI